MNCIKSNPINAYIMRAFALTFLLLTAINCLAATPENFSNPKSIRVVMDDNYPPYVFKNGQGELQGIIVDQWRLWEKKTGIHVEITGMDWAEALRRMQAGEFDVIDTIFRNEKREAMYDFSKPYARIDVPLFFHQDISGIRGPEDLKGFLVAVKAGDSAIDILKKNGVTNITEFPSYEKLIEAVRDGKAKVFTVDRPPALYFLNKMEIQNHFRETKPLYHGDFHRAVLKGRTNLLEIVENGFAKIPKSDYEAIDKRWMGVSLSASPYLQYAFYCIGAIAVFALLLMVWLWSLRRTVFHKTQELALSEERHRTILRTAMSGFYRTDMNGCLLEVNESYSRMSGYTVQELLTMSVGDLDAKEAVDDTVERLKKIMEKGEAHFESRHRRKDGTVFDVEVSVKYQPANGGECVAFLQDISDRKSAEEIIINSNKLLQTIIDTAPMRIFWKDKELRFLGCNSIFAKDAGVEYSEELVGKNDYQIAWKDQAELYRRDDFFVIESGLSKLSYEEPQTSPEGELKWLRTSKVPLRNNDNQIIGVLGMYEDITDHKHAEKLLMNEKALLRSLIDSATDLIYFKDCNGIYIGCNKASEKFIGILESQQIGKSDFDLFDHDMAEYIRQYDKKVLEEGEAVRIEESMSSLDGNKVILDTLKAPIYNADGQLLGLVGISRDITERKRAEEERQILEQQFQHSQKLESLGVLAGGIAHDFNNILAIIIGNCSLAMMAPDTADKRIPEIEIAAERAAGLCRQMLAYAGKAQPVMTQVNMTILVDEMVKMLQSTINQNVEIKPDLSVDVPAIIGDASQLRQVLMNLIINGAESIGESQGRVLVSLAKRAIGTNQREKDHLGTIIPSGLYACLEVTDNGCGMDAETKLRIFEPFYTTKFTGRGLGLSAVLGIISAHKGALQLFSQHDTGTTFKIYLPVNNGSDSIGEESFEKKPAETWQGSGTVLLVEDEESIRTMAQGMLELLGFRIIEAGNGKEALEVYQKNAGEIAIVLTDIGMPIMDGYSLIRELKVLNPRLPIIASSGFGDTVVTSKIPNGAIIESVSKPYNFDQLRKVLKRVVEGTHLNIV
ncbi:MAG: PAS domain S-box protein [Geobacteraceae bacterium]|nr:PAS domain S-box protein [Geobacteraceae bacterium]